MMKLLAHSHMIKLSSHSKQKGFTLMEVLIVVGILAILMIALLLSMSGQRDKAEDARVKAELDRLKIAFEDYYSDNNCYPPPEWFDSADDCGSNNLSPYLSSIPCDERTGMPYTLEYPDTQCSSFRLYATLYQPDESLCSPTGSDLGNYGVASSNITITPKCDAVAGGGGGGASSGPGRYICQGYVCNDSGNASNACPISFADNLECEAYCPTAPVSMQCVAP